MSTGPVWLNGRVVDPSEATVSVFDHGLTVGDGVFETMRTVRREPFAISRHLRRLRASAAGLGLAIDRDDDALRAAVAETIDAHTGGELRVRLTVTGGPGPAGSGRGDAPPTTLIVAGPLDSVAPTTTVVSVEWTRNERAAVVGLKTTSYAENVIALAAARERGATEALFANTAGELCEGTGSNVFVVVDGEILTPPLSSGCLAGITRELLLEVVDATERPLPIDVLDRADEMFLTSSTRDVQAVSHVDGRQIGDGEPGRATATSRESFAELQAMTTDP
ncbi:MAG TPA: aminotransferase class IV [Acidimicrobiales bacterium]|nr:aminotransferase class IV [Acidimicrobiales bacterium]